MHQPIKPSLTNVHIFISSASEGSEKVMFSVVSGNLLWQGSLSHDALCLEVSLYEALATPLCAGQDSPQKEFTVVSATARVARLLLEGILVVFVFQRIHCVSDDLRLSLTGLLLLMMVAPGYSAWRR